MCPESLNKSGLLKEYHDRSQTSGKVNWIKLSLQALLPFINVHIMLTVRADQSGDFPASKKKKRYIFETFPLLRVKQKNSKCM